LRSGFETKEEEEEEYAPRGIMLHIGNSSEENRTLWEDCIDCFSSIPKVNHHESSSNET